MTVPVIVRRAAPGDEARIAELLAELGYPSAPADIPQRLAAVERDDGVVFVAVDEHRGIVGVGSATSFATIHADARTAYITALVADERARGRGIGRAIVAAIEAWARERGATRLSVTSAEHRAGAHEFYPRIGFPYTGRRFTRSLD